MSVSERAPGHADVVVSNSGTRFGYNLVASLGRHGLRVAAGLDHRSGVVAFSRHAAARFRHPPAHGNEADFLEFLDQALLRYAPRVYLPGNEEVFLAARHRERITRNGVRIAVAPLATLERLHDKASSLQLAEELGIPTPRTIVPRSLEEISAFVREARGPTYLKLSRSSSSIGVFRLAREDVGAGTLRLLDHGKLAFGSFVLQEHVPGVGCGVGLLFEDGRARAHVAHRRLRERYPDGGPSTLRETVDQGEMVAMAEALLTAVEFHGLAMVEFRWDVETGRLWFLEVNPRPWGSLALGIRAGVDLPVLLYRLAAEGSIERAPAPRIGVRVRWLTGDLAAMHRRACLRRRLPAVREWFPRVDGYDEGSWGDPLPFVGSFLLPFLRRTPLHGGTG